MKITTNFTLNKYKTVLRLFTIFYINDCSTICKKKSAKSLISFSVETYTVEERKKIKNSTTYDKLFTFSKYITIFLLITPRFYCKKIFGLNRS